ncbi:MAG: hypothetical protein ABJA67_10960, partial [Chthonomonadales bacterium]
MNSIRAASFVTALFVAVWSWTIVADAQGVHKQTKGKPVTKSTSKSSTSSSKTSKNLVKSASITSPELPPPPVPEKPEFLRDVAPILDRSGCSTADCHGKFGGRGGFQVSLLTLSPEDDFAPIVYGARGRRINFAVPEQSLFLKKATGIMPHAGGQRFKVGSPEYRTILNWLKLGAPYEDTDPKLVSVQLSPSKYTLPKVGDTRQIRVIANYSDGSHRDVTTQTVYSSTNDAVLKVTKNGL